MSAARWTRGPVTWLAAWPLAFAVACAPAPTPEPAEAAAPAVVAPALNDGASLFALDVPLTDQHGRTLALTDLGGRVLVASMVYASCTSVCPRVVTDLKRLEQALPAAALDKTSFVLLSLDPARDTPERWQQFAKDNALDDARWRLLSSSEDGVRDLAAVLGVRYSPEANGEIAHTALIVVVDRLGVVTHRQVGLGQDAAVMAKAVIKAMG